MLLNVTEWEGLIAARKRRGSMALYEAGQYAEVLALFNKGGSTRPEGEDGVSLVAALAKTGDTLAAEAVRSRLSDEFQPAARFFLGLGLIRQSVSSGSTLHFVHNLRLLRTGADDKTRFFAHQGVGLARFFQNRFARALFHAKQSYVAAKAARYPFGEMLALDLLAHALLNTGQIRMGQKYLRQAGEIASRHGFFAIGGAIRFSSLKVRAQFGLAPESIVDEITLTLSQVSPNDTYSRAELLMELAKQLALRGRFFESKARLEETLEAIYSAGNLRQIARANLILSHLLYLRGEPVQALALIRAAGQNIDGTGEPFLRSQLLTLEIRIREVLGTPLPEQSTLLELQSLSRRMKQGTNARILKRELRLDSHSVSAGDDPLGDLLDGLKAKRREAFSQALSQGYLGAVAAALGIRPSGRVILLDPLPNGLLFVSPQLAGWVAKVPSLTRRLICLLQRGPSSKEAIVKHLWGYEYHPLKHDSLIYSTITRARTLLGGEDGWIEATESGYRLNSSLTFLECADLFTPLPSAVAQLDPPKPVSPSQSLSHPLPQQLNARQRLALKWIEAQGPISAPQYAARNGVTRMTAFRDLTALAQIGLVVRCGSGRATSYFVASAGSNTL